MAKAQPNKQLKDNVAGGSEKEGGRKHIDLCIISTFQMTRFGVGMEDQEGFNGSSNGLSSLSK